MLNCKELLVRARDYLNDPNKTLLSDDALLRHLNAFQKELWMQVRLSNENLSTVVDKDALSFSNFTQTYTNDTKINAAVFDANRISNISRVYRSDLNPVKRIGHIGQDAEYAGFNRNPDIDDNVEQDLQYELHGDKLVLYGTLPTALTISFVYEKSPGDMFVGKVNTITAGSGISTVEFLFSENPVSGRMVNDVGYYIGTRFQMTSTTENHKTFLVTAGAVSGTALTLTVPDASTGLTDADEVAWIPDVPQEFHETLAVGGAYRAAVSRQNIKLSQLLGQEKAMLQSLAVSMFEQRRTDSSRVVVETNTGVSP